MSDDKPGWMSIHLTGMFDSSAVPHETEQDRIMIQNQLRWTSPPHMVVVMGKTNLPDEKKKLAGLLAIEHLLEESLMRVRKDIETESPDNSRVSIPTKLKGASA